MIGYTIARIVLSNQIRYEMKREISGTILRERWKNARAPAPTGMMTERRKRSSHKMH